MFVILIPGKAIDDQPEGGLPAADTPTDEIKPGATSDIEPIRKMVRAKLKDIGEEFFHLLVGLMKLKEWTATGEVATGLLGFAKTSAKIEIKFGA